MFRPSLPSVFLLLMVLAAVSGCAGSPPSAAGETVTVAPSASPTTPTEEHSLPVLPSFRVYKTSGHIAADAVYLGVDQGSKAAKVTAPVAPTLQSIVAELRWSGDTAEFDLALVPPGECGTTDEPVQNTIDFARCAAEMIAGSNEEHFRASRPPGATGPGYLRIQLPASELEGDGCRGTDCEWDAVAVWELAVETDFDLHLTMFYDAEAPEGFSSFSQAQSVNEPFAVGIMPDQKEVTVVAGIAGLGLVVWYAARYRLALVGVLLFTRLKQHRLLEQPIRQQIHQVVQNEPGVRANHIAKTLQLGMGNTFHHLRAMEHAKLLTMVRVGTGRHYFETGVFSPKQMQCMVVLRNAGAARVFEAVSGQHSVPLQEVAKASRLSMPQTSRWVRRLAACGALETRRVGRVLMASRAPSGPVPTR